MNYSFQPISKVSLYFYFIGLSLLLFSWLDQWLELYLVSDTLRIQLFIISIIVIAIAAIINLASYLIGDFFSNSKLNSNTQNNKNNLSDDH